jgi:hypothetical protein
VDGSDVVSAASTIIREFPLGLQGPAGKPAVSLRAGERVVLKGKVSAGLGAPYRGERLIVITVGRRCRKCGATHPHPFSVLDLRVNGKTQLAVAGSGIPAMAFAETAVGIRLSLDECQPGQVIELELQNEDQPPWYHFWRRGTVQACIIGTVPEDKTTSENAAAAPAAPPS